MQDFQSQDLRGLSQSEVESRISAGQYNAPIKDNFKTNWEIFRDNLFNYFNLIIVIIAIVLIVFRSFKNLTFIAVTLINTAIGIFQEFSTREKLRKIELMTQAETKVIRDGEEVLIPNNEIVLDDIIVLKSGNQLSVDAQVISGSLKMNESQVTGESDKISKNPGDELLSGSFVISGEALAQVDKVSADTFVSQLAIKAKATELNETPGMMKDLDTLIRTIGLGIIPIASILFYNQYYRLGSDVKSSVESVAAAIVNMIPSGLYLLVSLALAAATIRLSKKKVLVQEMNSIESLARVDVICLDKTGTITDQEMQVRDVTDVEGKPADNNLLRIVKDFSLNMTSDNETIRTLQDYFVGDSSEFEAIKVLGFDSENKFSAVKLSNEETYVLGAPEILLQNTYPEIIDLSTKRAAEGERVLLLAEYKYEEKSSADIFAEGKLSAEVLPLALISLENPVRKEAVEIFKFFKDEGVRIIVISGDNTLTVSAVAKKANIQDADNYVDARTLEDEESLREAATKYTVFGRVKPYQKQVLIESLQDAGHTVAMVGDGVNDVLALKKADMGIAMASGADAASQIADVVLVDSDFSRMPEILNEGRQVINNIERSAALFLNKNISTLLIIIFCILLGILYPWQPVQASIISGLMVGFPGFLLATESNTSQVSGKFFINVLFNTFATSILALIGTLSAVYSARFFEVPAAEISTLAFYMYGLAAYIMLYRMSKPFNRRKLALFVAMGGCAVFATTVLSNIFLINRLSFKSQMICLALIAIILLVYKLLKFVFEILERKFRIWYDHRQKMKEKSQQV